MVVDLPQVAFKLPDKAGEHGRGLVKAFRFGLIMQGGSRIVLDTKGPVNIDKAFVLPADAGQPARLVLDLSRDRPRQLPAHDSLGKPPVRSAAISNSEVVPKADGDTRPLIVLDPGHGGIDTGARAAERRDGKGHRAAIREETAATA